MQSLRPFLFRAICKLSPKNYLRLINFFEYEKKEARPALLFGFSRSGATTFQKILLENLSYNSIFEPLHKNTANRPTRKFDEVSNAFRMTPDSVKVTIICRKVIRTFLNIRNYLKLIAEKSGSDD